MMDFPDFNKFIGRTQIITKENKNKNDKLTSLYSAPIPFYTFFKTVAIIFYCIIDHFLGYRGTFFDNLSAQRLNVGECKIRKYPTFPVTQ